MSRPGRSIYAVMARVVLGASLWTMAWSGSTGAALATEVELKDGRVLAGRLGMVSSLADQPQAAPGGAGPLQLIVFVDDDVRRIFVSKRQVVRVLGGDEGLVEEKFDIPQIIRASRVVKSVGPVLGITPFDEFGRRTYEFNTTSGPIKVIQGITQITPQWTKVEGLFYSWDMRMATSSIPADTLHKILWHRINPEDIEHRKKIARFYLQAERFEEARETLEDILKAFPDVPDLEEQLAPSIRSLRQLAAQRLLNELQLRRRAGQHRLVLDKLNTFPSEGVAGEILQAIREMVEQYATVKAQGEEVMQLIDGLLAQVEDVSVRQRITPIRDEIAAELNVNTLPRLTSFRLAVGDATLLPQEKLALAVSGWLLGSDAARENPAVALSLHRVRDLVRRYIAEPIKADRQQILGYLHSEEGAQPELVALLLANMKPPVDTPEPEDSTKPGFYALEVQGSGQESPVRYLVQLPPEYDPYRRYPTIVTLNGAGTTPEQQVDWWAGAWAGADGGGWRNGQAS
ncbi:MAG TPA: peptidase, partial [Thermoguttaceae bacterium]|nr:peptidase [Thermoguttaceae bacterium]